MIALDNHFTNALTYFFTNILIGGTTSPLTDTKYVSLYSMSANELVSTYNENRFSKEIENARLATSRVRISEEVNKDGKHYASFISTFNGLELHQLESGLTNICLVLGTEDYLFVATDLDYDLYKDLLDGLRVDIDWKITLDSMIEEVQEND